MLVLSRKLGEKIFIGDNICITVVDIDRGKIRLGIEAPRDVPIYRQELLPLDQQQRRGDPALDCALTGAQVVEDDLSARTSVGFGSLPDRIGRLTLDACVMDGKTLSCGAVAAVEHIKHPAALARRVMEKTPHVFLVGEGAKWFALQQGFPLEFPYTAESIREFLDKHPDRRKKG